ncbi:MAG: hypothetical protein ACLFSQ_03655 [Candidatus Zixiibacteriota bacterium]
MSSLNQQGQSAYIPPSDRGHKKSGPSPWFWLGMGCLIIVIIFLVVCAVGGKKVINFAKLAMITSMTSNLKSAYNDFSTFDGDREEFEEKIEEINDKLDEFEKLVKERKITFTDMVGINERYETAMSDSLLTRQEANKIMEEISELNGKFGVE